MKRTVKKVTLVIICIALILTSISSAWAITATPSKTNIMSPFAPYPQTITITVGRTLNAGQQYAKGESGTKNAYLDLVKKKLNVNFKVVWEEAPAQYNQKLALCIAGGTMPDTFYIQEDNMSTFRTLVEDNKLVDMTNLLSKCVGGNTAQLLKGIDLKSLYQYMTVNNKIYGYTAPNNGYNYDMLWIRNDWLKKLNLSAPKTISDVEKVALEFVKNKPGGQENTIGIALDPTYPVNASDGYYSMAPVCNALGSFPFTWIQGKDGKTVYSNTTQETKNALTLLNKWYNEGIIDKQFMTLKNMDEVTPMLVNSQCGMFFGGWWAAWPLYDMNKKNPDSGEWIPVLAPLNDQGKFAHSNPLSVPGGQVISKKCKYPEAVIKAANVIDEAEFFRAYDNDPAVVAMLKPERDAGAGGRTIQFVNPIANDFKLVPNFSAAVNEYKKTGKVTIPPSLAANKDYIEGAYQYTKNPDLSNNFQFVGHYSFDLAANLCMLPANQDVNKVFQGTTRSWADYWPAMDALTKAAMIQLICGQKPMSYFDDYVKQWTKLGGDIITKEVREAVGK